MSKKAILAVVLLTIGTILGLTWFTSSHAKEDKGYINPAFKEYISAFTSGYVSVESKLLIVLNQETTRSIEAGKAVPNDLFDFSPAIEGELTWIDNKTIEFKPAQKLKANQEYHAEFHLGRVLDVPSELKEFSYEFRTMKQAMELSVDDYKAVGDNELEISGTISTADAADPAALEKVLRAAQKGTLREIGWVHENPTTHHFTITHVQKTGGVLMLNYDGEEIGADEKGSKEISIPNANEFVLMHTIITNEPEQYITLQFSDPVDQSQDLNGLIALTGQLANDNNNEYDGEEGGDQVAETANGFSFLVENNEVKIYTGKRYSGDCSLSVNHDLKNRKGKSLIKDYTETVTFEDLKPAVRLTGKGVILPSSNGLIFPFDAVNLNAVDVRITKIYENNILQFLQVNNLEGQSELRRVGKLMIRKKVKLQDIGDPQRNRWNKYSLDLSSLIKAEPGAVYSVRISFNRDYSIYSCTDTTSSSGSDDEEVSEYGQRDDDDSEEREWDYYNSYDSYGDDYYYYDYRNRNNPCSKAYYNGKSVARNILASNIGLIAKRGNNGEIRLFCSDLISTQPLGNVSIEAYDYQQRKLKTVTTDGSGQAMMELPKKPFVLIAKKGQERSYLKLDDGSSLSLSMFEVNGDVVQKGIKGFVYGERGVWRPGDSLFLSFILENKNKEFPANYPASLELSNPLGQVVQKLTRTVNVDGFYNFSTKTESSAPTGVYTARVKVGGATFTKNIRVESIMPNRLKLNLAYKEGDMIYSSSLKLNSGLQVNWLHGAPGRNLETKVDVSLSQTATEFKGYKGYVFDNPAQSFYSETQTVFTGHTDENGFTQVDAQLNDTRQAPGFLNANFTIRAFEEGGAFSTDRFTVPVSPYPFYVGVNVPEPKKEEGYLETDQDHTVQIATVDEFGKPASRSQLEVKVYKISWRWWWDNYNEDLSSYIGSNYHQPIYSEMLSSSNGKASFKLRVNRPAWGRYLVYVKDVESGHATGKVVFIDWPSWAGKSPKGNEGATMLSINTDKSDYKVGEKAKIVIPSPQGGKALLNVENGSRVLLSKWIDTEKGTTTYELPITKEMTPNVYVYVHMIQPHAQTVNELPIRLYGVVPLMVKDENTILKPQISTAAVWQPESTASVKVSEKDGKEMAYTLAVVDEGLLDLTRFKTPDPWSAFYAKEALGVKTWDVYDHVIGAFGTTMNRILSIGGDSDGAKSPENSANRFKPMVRFVGPFHLKKGETATHQINIPQYVGSVRVMVVAGYQGAYGNAEKAVPVRKPLMILSTLPRVLGPGEEVDLPVTVFAMEKKVKQATVTISTDKFVKALDGNTKTVSFDGIGDKVVTFRLKVSDALGVSKIKINASGAGEKTGESIEIAVRANNPRMTDAAEFLASASKPVRVNYEPMGLQGTNRAYLELSTLPAINLSQRLNYLLEYPHGCVEQTTSSVFAALFLDEITELTPSQKTTIDQNVKAAIQRLRSFQTQSGGLSYWPGLNTADDWGTNYAGHFLLEAQNKGYSLPYALLDNWKKYQKTKAQNYSANRSTAYYGEDLAQAYRLYTLALAKAPELSAMNRLRETKNLSTEAKWRLAAAYALAGQTETAKKLATGAIVPQKERYDYYYYTYGSYERDDAMILETMVLLKDNNNGFLKVKELATQMGNSNYWMSTQTTAYCLMAISKFAKTNAVNASLKAECRIGTETVSINDFNKYKFRQIELKDADKGRPVAVTVSGGGNLFVRLVKQGVAKAGLETDQFSNLELEVAYKTLAGNSIEVNSLEQGTDFIAEISVKNPGIRGPYRNLALNQIFASGWEIRNQRMDNITYLKGDLPTYQDIRDDRVYTYFDLGAGVSKTFKVMLNAAYTGHYYLPGIACEAMYDNSISAHRAGKWVDIVKGGLQ